MSTLQMRTPGSKNRFQHCILRYLQWVREAISPKLLSTLSWSSGVRFALENKSVTDAGYRQLTHAWATSLAIHLLSALLGSTQNIRLVSAKLWESRGFLFSFTISLSLSLSYPRLSHPKICFISLWPVLQAPLPHFFCIFFSLLFTFFFS